ncbi:alkaline phosphatase family protein [Pseudalkalibacillus decolorationis]|uniref:alkaline phosphatase family protein n=1 Tax=Pseudalkalibacillus decolorationis TaxID=163879 RepID=UPI002147A4BC|nr:alkaline phosphatase family protein [Pseudalkalibacillus decolorationis]
METSSEKEFHPKPVIMIIVDTLMDVTLQKALENNQAPVFQFLKENGQYFPTIVSPFPTMSVTVDTTLLTGTHPDQHRLPGLVWFNKKENRLINYGTSFKELRKLGIHQSLEDLFFNLNNKHISQDVTTIHEELENNDQTSASINALVFKGNTDHYYSFPKLMKWMAQLDENRAARASSEFSYGRFSKFIPSTQNKHFWKRFGFNNKASVQELNHLIKKDKLPPFTIVYLPDLDKWIHKHGRMYAKGIEKVDQQLQNVFDSFDSWEEAVEKYTWIILGDNGQAWIDSDKQRALVDLRGIFDDFKIMKLKNGVTSDDQIVLGVNERMAFIYSLDPNNVPVENLVPLLEKDDRVDVIAWKNKDHIEVRSGVQKGELRFHPDGDYTDDYEQTWFIKGDTDLLDLTLTERTIEYGEYPDALARLHSCLNSHDGDYLIASAKPGYEFIGEGSPTHVGGASHGGLHEQDSLIPMIVTGTDSSPSHLRMVDLKEWILSLL